MSEWDLRGQERKNQFERNLEPDELAYTLKQYQKVLGNGFGIAELMELQHIKALALIAEAVNDVPEFLLDQVGKARNSWNFPSIPEALESVAEAISEIKE